MGYSEKDLDQLISQSINNCETLPRVCKFATTKAGFNRVHSRVKQHILKRGIDNVDTALALVEQELEQPNVELN